MTKEKYIQGLKDYEVYLELSDNQSYNEDWIVDELETLRFELELVETLPKFNISVGTANVKIQSGNVTVSGRTTTQALLRLKKELS